MTLELLAVDSPLTLMCVYPTVYVTLWVSSQQEGCKEDSQDISLYLCFLQIPQLPPKDMHHWQFCNSKISAGVNVEPLNRCTPHLPRDGWDKLQHPATLSAR